MKSRFLALSVLHLKSAFGVNIPSRTDLKSPKKLLKTIAIGIGILLLAADFSVMFVFMNLNSYEGLARAGMQSMLLLNAATTAGVFTFIMAFMMALSLFSTANIEANLLSLPIKPRELLGAKMVLVGVSEAFVGFFLLAIAAIIYGIKEHPPLMFYVNTLLSALALPLVPIALAYLVIIPLVRANSLFKNRNFMLYVVGFLGMIVALGFNVYIQKSMVNIQNPEALVQLSGPESLVGRIGRAWLPSWLVWKSLASADSIPGFLAALANLALGAACVFGVTFISAKSYVEALRSFGESTLVRNRSGSAAKGRLRPRPRLLALAFREYALMNREPMYFLNGPFVIVLMPVLIGIVFLVQRETLQELEQMLAPLLAGPTAYLVPAAIGAFLGSATSIACTAVSRDAKALGWMKSLPIRPMEFFLAKLLHAELFTLLGVVFGALASLILLSGGVADALLGALLGLLYGTAFNMGGLWLETAWPRLHWDNPIAALKQNPNSVIGILSAMGSIGGLGYLATRLDLPRYGYAVLYGGFFALLIVVWAIGFPRFAARRYAAFEA